MILKEDAVFEEQPADLAIPTMAKDIVLSKPCLIHLLGSVESILNGRAFNFVVMINQPPMMLFTEEQVAAWRELVRMPN